MPHYLHSSTNTVTIYPQYDYMREDKKIRTISRTKDGSRFVYNWASYFRVKFGLNYLTSSEAQQINDWWDNDTPLSYINNSGTVTSCYIVNRSTPIGKIHTPYQEPNKGVIELESS